MKCFHSPQKQITPVMARSRVYDCGITLLHTVGVCSLTSVWSGTLLTSLSTSIVVTPRLPVTLAWAGVRGIRWICVTAECVFALTPSVILLWTYKTKPRHRRWDTDCDVCRYPRNKTQKEQLPDGTWGTWVTAVAAKVTIIFFLKTAWNKSFKNPFTKEKKDQGADLLF